jgi:hypothetical protein
METRHPGWSNGLYEHPRASRRWALQAGAIGILGLGMEHVAVLRALAAPRGAGRSSAREPRSSAAGVATAKSVIFIFLSGGLSQLESFDLKPEAPEGIRGEFRPVATRTPGLSICEHLPRLAQRSELWALVRSLSHGSNDHSAGHHIMLTGRSELPPGFDPNRPRPGDWPSIAAIAGSLSRPRNNLPPAVVLPEKLVHNTGRVIPGQFAGEMGQHHDPWFVEASPFEPRAYGAYPTFEFDHQERPQAPNAQKRRFQAPFLGLPQGFSRARLTARLSLLKWIDQNRAAIDRMGGGGPFEGHRQAALSVLADPKVRTAFDVVGAEAAALDRYGRHAFGWSLLMARRLVEAGVNLVQVNLGNNETWDTHGNMFPHLKEKLFPPTDQALSALLDDLKASGLLDSTLIVMAGEFGRTPRISTLPQYYKLPGRDHWGRVQSVFIAGGGTAGGRVVGSSDKMGGFPRTDPQTPENLAATIYKALGLPSTIAWHDAQDRPHYVYRGEPIAGLF